MIPASRGPRFGRDRDPSAGGELEPARGQALERTGPYRRAESLSVGEHVLIRGGIFEGRTGVIEAALPSGKLRVRVETHGSLASARVHPADLERLGIPAEGTEEEG